MSMRHGISLNHDGTFEYASVKNTRNGWKINRMTKRTSHDQLRNYLLLHRAVSLGLPGEWVRNYEGEQDEILSARQDDSFTFCTSNTEYEHYTDLLLNNLDGVYPDDSVLSTIPVHFCRDTPSSFISLLNTGKFIKIGIIVNDTLFAVFKCIATTGRELTGFLGRIERYLNDTLPACPFPGKIFLLNDIPFLETATLSVTRLSTGTDSAETLHAIGSALCGVTAGIPQLSGPSPESGFRIPRLILFTTALLFLALSIIAGVAVSGYRWQLERSAEHSKQRYHHILSSNKEIRDLIKKGNKLSEKVLRMNSLIAQPTSWAPFLQFLGTCRPSGLYLERLGSEPLNKSPGRVRVAIAGWCQSETIVTEFIGALNESPSISDVTLSSMVREKRHSSLCRFKIICLLQLSKD
jgi:hypothetical protein